MSGNNHELASRVCIDLRDACSGPTEFDDVIDLVVEATGGKRQLAETALSLCARRSLREPAEWQPASHALEAVLQLDVLD
jgi:hypothetical protein